MTPSGPTRRQAPPAPHTRGLDAAGTDPSGSSRDAAPTRVLRAPTDAELAAARAVVMQHLAPTPAVPVRLPGVDGEVVLKLETLQPTGSFKVRGALAALAAYTGADALGGRAESRRGAAAPDGDTESPEAALAETTRARPSTAAGADLRVVAASAGNHGLGVAFAAARLGVAATVVVPETASPAKVAALRRFDVELVQHGDDYEAAERHALGLAADGAVFASPYNDAHVIAGQSTLALEVQQQVGDDITLVVPVGGGGLLAGTGLAAPDATRLVGAEAAASPAVSAAVTAGEIVEVPIGKTIADGLGGNLEPGAITPAVMADRVHSFVHVGEDQIAEAIRVLATECGLVAEGAAAVGVAALMAGTVPVAGRPVVVLTGRNIAPALLADLLSR